MRIVDIIGLSADMLGLTEVRDLLEGKTEEHETELLENKEIASLFNLIKFSFQELCTNYIPVENRVSVVTTECAYQVSMLPNFIRINNVLKNGEQVKYKIINRSLVFEQDGEYVVEYSTYPEIVSLFEEIDFLKQFSVDVVVNGLCAYYSLSHGMFEEFNNFHDMYVEKAENIRELKVFNMPQRRWE